MRLDNVFGHRLFRRLRRREEGAALLEFALALPIFLMLIWAVVDFGRLLFTANSLAGAVREGARYAAVLPSPSTRTDSVRAVVRRTFVPMGGPALTDAQIVVTDGSATNGTVSVAVQGYALQMITPLASVVGATVSLTRQATFRWERAGL